MSLRIKIAVIFTLGLSIGYFTGVHSTKLQAQNAISRAFEEKDSALKTAKETQARLDSLCGDAVLKFIPCPAGLEVCACGSPDKYLD